MHLVGSVCVRTYVSKYIRTYVIDKLHLSAVMDIHEVVN